MGDRQKQRAFGDIPVTFCAALFGAVPKMVEARLKTQTRMLYNPGRFNLENLQFAHFLVAYPCNSCFFAPPRKTSQVRIFKIGRVKIGRPKKHGWVLLLVRASLTNRARTERERERERISPKAIREKSGDEARSAGRPGPTSPRPGPSLPAPRTRSPSPRSAAAPPRLADSQATMGWCLMAPSEWTNLRR